MKNLSQRLLIILTLLLPATALVSSASSAETKLEATIFSYDDGDFVRTETTLMEEGKTESGTKLDHDSAAYKALSGKRSWSGPTTLFGQDYEGHYAPVTDPDGNLTGALFVGVSK